MYSFIRSLFEWFFPSYYTPQASLSVENQATEVPNTSQIQENVQARIHTPPKVVEVRIHTPSILVECFSSEPNKELTKLPIIKTQTPTTSLEAIKNLPPISFLSHNEHSAFSPVSTKNPASQSCSPIKR